MPFPKRTILPSRLCRADSAAGFSDLGDVCERSLRTVLRQLADLCRHSAGLLEELEHEVRSVSIRSGILESRLIRLYRHLSGLQGCPPRTAGSNLDLECKRTIHFRSSWQQTVNVFCSSTRPPCVEELHQEAQLNLQNLLQGDGPVSDQLSTLVDTVPLVSDNGKVLTEHTKTQSLSPALQKIHSDLEQVTKKNWYQNNSRMENNGMLCTSPSWNGPKDSTFSPSWNNKGRTLTYIIPLSTDSRETNPCEESMKRSSQCDSGLSLNTGSQLDCETGGPCFLIRDDLVKGLEANSVISTHVEPILRPQNSIKKSKSDIEGQVLNLSITTAGHPNLSSEAKVKMNKFRERSLSTPTDSGSFSSLEIFSDNRVNSDNYALCYPSASSEESTSTDNISVVTEQEGQERQRSKSISLKKAKKKPPPPVRGVSLLKDGTVCASSLKDQRPKSLCLPSEYRLLQYEFSTGHDGMQQTSSVTSALRDSENTQFSHHWYLSDWKTNDPYRSLSSSSTATGTTVTECIKARGSSESLTSPSTSRATTPSQLSFEAESKVSSPGKPHGLMSPSSGYSSQSEAATPTIPTSMILGPAAQQNKKRPQIPERKSSLPPVSPKEKSPSSRKYFELPATPPTHLDLSGLKISQKGKTKASRRHSDSSAGSKHIKKLSPSQPAMPMITQSDLNSIRLRSVSKSEPEDDADGLDCPEEQNEETIITSQKKVKPPVAEKPPLSKRPQNLNHSSYCPPQTSPTASSASLSTFPCVYPNEQSCHIDSIYTVIKKTKQKKNQATESLSGSKHLTSQSLPSQNTNLNQVSYLNRRHSQSSQEGEDSTRIRNLPEKIIANSLVDPEKKRTKVPPPVPKKPNVLHLPTNTAHIHGCTDGTDQGLPSSPVITLQEVTTGTCDSVAQKFLQQQKVEVHSNTHAGDKAIHDGRPECNPRKETGTSENNTGSLIEKSPVGDKTAESLAEEDDEVFIQSGATRTTEDLFTVIHRSKRKVLGWKDPGFGGKPSSVSPVKNTSISPVSCDSKPISPGSGSNRSSSRNEDFKALLQKKSSKPSSGARTSATELLKSTNPLARRIATEFSQDSDGTDFTKS
nr:PREDICTED: NHS-like protein 2 [Latimeria chalumnae]|eukprot:XP_005992962.1 PREDICTED: NHS-like protein 2 [Latimeria chalumnae]